MKFLKNRASLSIKKTLSKGDAEYNQVQGLIFMVHPRVYALWYTREISSAHFNNHYNL